MTMVKKLAQGFVERAKALGYKGKKRDAAAMDYFCGALMAMREAKHPEFDHVAAVATLVLATRGYGEIEKIANMTDEKEAA
jgi:hypothetical protein